jgi:hypothetical protein
MCDGYEIKKISTPPPLPKKARLATGPRNLLPISLAPIKLASLPVSISFQDELQERYFHLFHNETATELSSGFGSELWGRLVPQACHDEPCILHCAVALSALSKAFRLRSAKTLLHTTEAHHQYALQQYGKALKGVREVIARGQNSLRTVLIAALLIFCFENFHGDVRLALTNVQSAVELMHGWLANNVARSTSPGFSPAPSVVDDSIVTAFTRLDVHLMSWVDSPHPIRGSILQYAAPNTRPIPTTFKTLQEASTCFEHVVNQAFQFLRTIPETRRQCEGFPYNDIYDENGNQFVESYAAVELCSWSAAFKPLFDQTRGQEVELEFQCASLLRTHALILEIAMQSAFFNPKEVRLYGVFLPEYCEIVALCRKVAQHPLFVKSFVFDSGIVSSLFVVVTKCPDRAVRQEALSILKMATPRREGVWDSSMVLRIGQDLMKFEEENDAVQVSDGVQVHLNCLSTTFQLPKASKTEPQGSLAMLNYFYDYMADQHRCQ